MKCKRENKTRAKNQKINPGQQAFLIGVAEIKRKSEEKHNNNTTITVINNEGITNLTDQFESHMHFQQRDHKIS